jgi:tight adherence protein B
VQTLGSTGRLVILSDGEDTSSQVSLSETVSLIEASTVSMDLVTYNVGDQGQQVYEALVGAAGERGSITSVMLAADLAQTLAATVNAIQTTLVLSATVPESTSGQPLLELRVAYGDVVLTGQVAVQISASSDAAFAPVDQDVGRSLVIGAALLASGLLIFIPSLVGRRRPSGSSLAHIRHYSADDVSVGGHIWATDVTRSALVRLGRRESIAATLDGAGLKLTPESWVLVRMAAPMAATLVLLVITGPLLAILLGVSAGIMAPRLVVSWRRGRAKRTFEASLPDVLMLIAGSLRVGFSLEQAIAGAAEDREDVVGSELRRALREMHVGSSLPEVLDRVADRMDSRDFRWVVTTLTIQRRTGASLSELLEGSARTMRERTQLKRDVKALTGEGRLSAWILGGLPFFIFAFLFLIRREYVQPLWATPMGLMLVTVGAIFLGIGALWMKALIKVEV